LLALTLTSCLAGLLAADLYLLIVHFLHCREMLNRERDLVSRPPVEPPLVCVQLPIHNEAVLVARAIDELCSLDWPRDCLEVLILDDASTDGSTAIIEERISLWTARGVRVRAHRREIRRDYKAGLLTEGLKQTKARYIAVFDVDCWPSASTLQSLMAVLLSDPTAAFVQARLDHRNRNRNWLTRAQAVELDTLLAYEHAARNWAGIPITFNGTCAVWRREAIEQSGGWSGRSLAEDQDLSFRAFGAGRTCRFLVTISVAGELPDSFAALSAQRLRWGTGTAQQAHVFHHRLLSRLGWRRGTVFVLSSLFHAVVRPLLAVNIALVVMLWLWLPVQALVAGQALGAVAGAMVLVKSVGALRATIAIGRPVDARVVLDIGRMWALQALLIPNACRAVIRALTSTGGEFVRTPKRGES
jgi:cellulose synthase/poly-beta-1,6-N-acetylglucosamine synthase-like glycosyltransferase